MAQCEHDDYIKDVKSGEDRQGNPWVTTTWKCRKCQREWIETHGPGA